MAHPHPLHLQALPLLLRHPLLLPILTRIRDLLLLVDIRNLDLLLEVHNRDLLLVEVQERATYMEGHLPYTLKLLPLITLEQILEQVPAQHLDHLQGQHQDLPQAPTQVLSQAQAQVQPQPQPQTALQMPTT